MGRSGNVDAIRKRWLLEMFLGTARRIIERGEWNSGKRCIGMAPGLANGDFHAKARVHGREDQRRPITYLVNLQSLSAKIPRTSTLLIIFDYFNN